MLSDHYVAVLGNVESPLFLLAEDGQNGFNLNPGSRSPKTDRGTTPKTLIRTQSGVGMLGLKIRRYQSVTCLNAIPDQNGPTFPPSTGKGPTKYH